jgi:hypothetical protein
MNRRILSGIKATTIGLTILFISILTLHSCQSKPDKNMREEITDGPSKGEKYPEWFKDAKFGMFIHWGPYSQLAGEWDGRHVEVGKEAEWIMKDLSIPVNKYREMAHKMNPVMFDAHQWVQLAKAAGMKYIVITAKHHDGFAMYKSKITSYNIVDWTQFKRDPLKELSVACTEAGIKFVFTILIVRIGIIPVVMEITGIMIMIGAMSYTITKNLTGTLKKKRNRRFANYLPIMARSD